MKPRNDRWGTLRPGVGSGGWSRSWASALALLLLGLGRGGIAVGAAEPVLITNAITVTSATQEFDGLDVIVSGATVTLARTNAWTLGSLVLTNGALLTHPAGDTNGLRLEVSGGVTITTNSAIWVSARGYGVNAGPGRGYSPNNRTGAGHGGRGGDSVDRRDWGGVSYGSVTEPTDLGSGAGDNSGAPALSGTGGGAVRLSVQGRLTVDGSIRADGTAYHGGGAGGSVWLVVNELAGIGLIAARGGNTSGNEGGGGGGRIAVYFRSDSYQGEVLAYGGSGWQWGGAGTIYWRDRDESLGEVRVVQSPDAPASAAQTEFKGVVTLDSLRIGTNSAMGHPRGEPLHLSITSHAVIEAGGRIDVTGRGQAANQGDGRGYSPNNRTGGGYGGRGGDSVDRRDLGGLTHGTPSAPEALGSGAGDSAGAPTYTAAGGGALRLTVQGRLTLNGAIHADGTAYHGGGSGGSVWLEVGELAGGGLITAHGGSTGGNEGGGGGGRIAVHFRTNLFDGAALAYGGSGWQWGGAGTVHWWDRDELLGEVRVANNTNAPSSAARTEFKGAVTLDGLRVGTNGVLGHPREQPLHLTVTGNAVIEAEGSIDVSGRGYAANRGGGRGSSPNNRTGAGYGGRGGDSVDQRDLGGSTYGQAASPTELGSGAGDSAGAPVYTAAGGGALRMVVHGRLTVDGAIRADGTTYHGGGSGGSVWLEVGVLSGSGIISADGGNTGGNEGGGGGGRIAIHFHTNLFQGDARAYGGTGWQWGGAGTVHWWDVDDQLGEVRVANSTLAPAGSARTEFEGSVTLDQLRVGSKGVVSHPRLQALELTVTGDTVVEPGGRIDVSGRGYPANQGPGRGFSPNNRSGGGHGGRGGQSVDQRDLGGLTYGSVTHPKDFGSGAGDSAGAPPGAAAGGGALRLTVGGRLTVDGGIYANGTTYHGGGSGGSVWLEVGELDGTGVITANGGNTSGNEGGGGGGRVAVYHRGMLGFTSDQISATGGEGWEGGGSGTVFIRDESTGTGLLVVDRRPGEGQWASTELSGDVLVPGDMRLRSGARLKPRAVHPLQLSVQGNLIISGGAALVADGLGYPAGTGPGAGVAGSGLGSGGGHGGLGGNATDPVGGPLYGSSNAPIEFGSGGGGSGGSGGGAIRMSVLGILNVAGTLSANGAGATHGGGAGGSIYVRARGITVTSTGRIEARGGASGTTASSGGGAGGRIALHHFGDPVDPTRVSVAGGAGRQAGGDGTLVELRQSPADRPILESVIPSPSQIHLAVVFSRLVSPESATNTTAYAADQGLAILGAELQPDLRTVFLTTSPQAFGQYYLLSVTGVRDVVGNEILPGSGAGFTGMGAVRGFADQRVYDDIPGRRLGDLYASPKWPGAPFLSNRVPRLECNGDDIDGDTLAARLTGYLVPQVTGDYRFLFSSDDNGAFYLSEDHDPDRLRWMAAEPYYGGFRTWTGALEQGTRGSQAANISEPVHLVAGRYYYFDGRMKEGIGPQALSVAWILDGSPLPANGTGVITNALLAVARVATGPVIAEEPLDQTAFRGQDSGLSVKALGQGPLTYQWYFAGSPVAEGTSALLPLPAIQSTAAGNYQVVITNLFGAVTSRVARVTVDPGAGPTGLEGDVTGDGLVGLPDVTRTGRMAVSLEPMPGTATEFTRADSAPRSTRGDGRISVADWTQSLRYVARLDPATPAGGPSGPGTGAVAQAPSLHGQGSGDSNGFGAAAAPGEPRVLSLAVLEQAGRRLRLEAVVDARGGENALGFSVRFEPSRMALRGVDTGEDAVGALLLANTREAGRGVAGFALALPVDVGLGSGRRQVAVLEFETLEPGRHSVVLDSSPVRLELASVRAAPLPLVGEPASLEVSPVAAGWWSVAAPRDRGGVQLRLQAPPGGRVRVAWSPDLMRWEPLGEGFVVPDEGVVTLEDPAVGATSHRFYRVEKVE